MGALACDGDVIEFDDRLLTHLQIVLMQRFKAGEPVLLSWLDPLGDGDGRSSIWLTPTAVVHFKFAGSRVPTVDRAWLHRLTEAASSGPGLVVQDEHGELLRATAHRPLPYRR